LAEGSGLGSLLIERLSADYEKKSKFSVPIYPNASSSTSHFELYNAVLATKYQMDHINMVTLMENDALSKICTNRLQIEKPGYENMNSVAAHMISSLTAGIRYNGGLNGSLKEMHANLIPYPVLPFTFTSYAPFFREGAPDAGMNSVEIQRLLIAADCMSIKCDPDQGKYIGTTFQFRGDYVPKDIGLAHCDLQSQRRMKFVDWSPTRKRCGIIWEKPFVVPGSKIRGEKRVAGMLANSSAISQMFCRYAEAFDEMYKNRASLDCYLSEGMEEEEFFECRERLTQLLMDYRKMEREEQGDIKTDELIGTEIES